MSDWLFSSDSKIEAKRYFSDNGFVGFSGLLSQAEVSQLRSGVEAATAEGRLVIGAEELANNNDCVFAHPAIMETASNANIVETCEYLIDQPVNMQHSKFNAKPVNNHGGGAVLWHQDFPFYPHTNFDLASCIIHLDDEGVDAGPIRFINGSHKWGPLSHVDSGGNFAYQCTERDDLDSCDSTLVQCAAGTVTFHHGLTVHSSAPKHSNGHRRYVIFQYRAIDSIQLAGVVWKCNGMAVSARHAEPVYARLAGGTRVELRGNGGKLVDLFGAFAPNSQKG